MPQNPWDAVSKPAADSWDAVSKPVVPPKTSAPAPALAPKPATSSGGILSSIEGLGKSAWDAVSTAVKAAPTNRKSAQAEIAQRNSGGLLGAPKRLGNAAVGAAKGAVADTGGAIGTLKEDLKTSGGPGFLGYAGHGLKTVLDTANLPLSPISGAIKGAGLATDMQARTGLSKDTNASLLAGLVPFEKPISMALGAGKRAVAPAVSTFKSEAGKMLSPSKVDQAARDTATLHRQAYGTRRAEADAEKYALNRHYKIVNNTTPSEKVDLASYVESRSSGGKLSNPALKGPADTMRDTYKRYAARIGNTVKGADRIKFIEDYYTHLWKDPPAKVAQSISDYEKSQFIGKQGSGRNLKARSIPTYKDGLAAGLTPVFDNPLDATSHYADNMANFLATHDVQNRMKELGIAKWVPERAVPNGYVKLDRIGTTHDKAFIDKNTGQAVSGREVLVAPENAARVYNNHISKGFSGPGYDALRKTSNSLTQLKLSASAFHAMTMGQEGIANEVGKAIGQATRGKPVEALKTVAGAPLAPVTKMMKGGALRKEILDPAFKSGMDPRIADAYVKAGGRVNMDRFYSSNSASGDFMQSWKRGQFKKDLTEALATIKDKPLRGSAELAARAIETSMAPLFKEYIPRVKAGAFASRMETFLKENPGATEKQIQQIAEQTVDNIDDRFGEMITDNQFWKKQNFQIAQLMLLSPSWTLGTVRGVGGAFTPGNVRESVEGLMSGKGITDKAAYAAGLMGTAAMANGIATKLMTGEDPTGSDWLAYRTGGVDLHGAPERGMMPGYMKDILHFTMAPDDWQNQIEDKANPALSFAWEALQNKDYFGRPNVRPLSQDAKTPAEDLDLDRIGDFAKFAGQSVGPISLESKGPDNPNSKFGPISSFLGMRQAPSYIENPARRDALAKKYDGQAWKAKQKAERKQERSGSARASAASPWDAVSKPVAAPAASPWDAVSKPVATPTVKAGATAGGDVRPELKPILAIIPSVPGFHRITAENDLYHGSNDVHGQGRAVDFTIKGGKAAAAAAADQLRSQLAQQGISAKVMDEYNHPSRNATGGHIHVQIA